MGRISLRSHSVETSGAAAGSGCGGGISCGGVKPLCNRANAARGWRNFDWGDARVGRACKNSLGPSSRIRLGALKMSNGVISNAALRAGRLTGLLRCAFCGLLAALLCSTTLSAAPAEKSKTLQIYFVDVEGGQATLFVTPEGQSLLIDTGWPGNDGRDADRIVAAAKLAGISKIDYVLITHFHDDHVGGVPQLVARIPVGTFIDHGENRETTNAPTVQDWKAYQQVLGTGKFKRITAKPGDLLPIQGMRVSVVSSDGALIDKPLPGAGAENSACKNSEQRPADQTENPRSLGTLITFGKLKLLDLGDLTWDKEMEMMCPRNKLGKIDVYIVSHHG